MNPKLKVLVVILVVALFVAIGATTYFLLRQPKMDEKNTAYDVIKQNKMNNFTYLNTNGYAMENQTVLIGDSITEIYNSQELFSGYTNNTQTQVYNRGISGDTSDRLLERLETNALNIKPKNLVILIGTNDVGRGFENSEIAENIEAIITKTQEICPTTNIILQAIYPVRRSMNPGMVGRRNNTVILGLNVLLKEIATKKGISFLDLTAALASEDGEIREDTTYDGLHLNINGFKIVTDGLLPLLK